MICIIVVDERHDTYQNAKQKFEVQFINEMITFLSGLDCYLFKMKFLNIKILILPSFKFANCYRCKIAKARSKL